VRLPSYLRSALTRFGSSAEAATTAEYGIVVVVVAALSLGVLSTFRTSLGTLYTRSGPAVSSAVSFDAERGNNGGGNNGGGNNGGGNNGGGNNGGGNNGGGNGNTR
jgi:Flp pilus assembly pilin Flp